MELSIDFFLTFVKLRKMVWQAIPGCLPFLYTKTEAYNISDKDTRNGQF